MNFHMELDLLDATRHFWSLVMESKFDELADLLAPDCRIQDHFSNTGRGANGVESVIAKFKEVNEKIIGAKIDQEMKYLQLMRNQTQVRFMIIGTYGFMNIVLGFALEWQHGIVVAVVVMRRTSTEIFLKDETLKPIPVEHVSPMPPAQAAATCVTPEKSTDGSGCSGDELGSAESTDGKWFPGKNIKRRLSQHSAATKPPPVPVLDSSAAPFRNQTIPAATVGDLGGMLNHDLQPPFLIPKPPDVPATLTITLLKCTNLKSRLPRLIPRPINCYAEVNLHDVTRSTPVVSNSANPVFDSTNGHNKFMFEIPNLPAFNSRNGMIVITLKDKHALVSEDVLAVVYIPLISLKCSDSNAYGNSTNLCIPLDLFEKQKFGKKFIHPIESSGANDLAAIARSRSRTTSNDKNASTSSSSNVSVTEDTPCLFISVNKVDMYQWWVLAELKEREEEKVREKVRLKESRRLARLEREFGGMQIPDVFRKKEPAHVPSDVKTIHPDHLCSKKDWVNDNSVDICPGCGAEFGVMIRKHHCRICGQVFCNPCSSYQVELLDTTDGKIVRVCRDCHVNTPNETTYHNNTDDKGSDSDDSEGPIPTAFLKDTDRSPSVRLSGPSKNPNVLIGKVSIGHPVETLKATTAAASDATKPYIVGNYVASPDDDSSSDDTISTDDCVGDEEDGARHRVSSTDSTDSDACIIS